MSAVSSPATCRCEPCPDCGCKHYCNVVVDHRAAIRTGECPAIGLCDDGDAPYLEAEVSVFRGRGDEWFVLEWWGEGIGYVVSEAAPTLYACDSGPQHEPGLVGAATELLSALKDARRLCLKAHDLALKVARIFRDRGDQAVQMFGNNVAGHMAHRLLAASALLEAKCSKAIAKAEGRQ